LKTVSNVLKPLPMPPGWNARILPSFHPLVLLLSKQQRVIKWVIFHLDHVECNWCHETVVVKTAAAVA
jgi:hypothetical protein